MTIPAEGSPKELEEVDVLEKMAAMREELRQLSARLAASERFAAVDLQAKVEAMEAGARELKARLAASETELNAARKLLGHTRKHFARMEQELDAARSKLDVDERHLGALRDYRASREYADLYRKTTPLVSVCVATYNRSRLLMERCLPSILGQDYSNLEVIIVGDGCTDDTAEKLAGLQDPRVRFVNLPQREEYPEDPLLRWMVAGTAAGNHAITLAQGDLITHLDDDDEHTPDRLRKLVAFLLETRSELVWHPFRREIAQEKWEVCPADEFRLTQVTNGSVLYLSWFNRVPWDPKTYQYREPGDWNRFRKLKYLGAKLNRFPEPLLNHYRERSQAVEAPPREPA